MRLFFISLIVFFSLLFPVVFVATHSNSTAGQVAGIKSQTAVVTVNATVGDHNFSLFGYSSPYALITLEGMGISDKTYAGKTGYFAFSNRFSPLSPREACLSAQDQMGRISTPVCLPPFPIKYDASIGPVIMPPTVSLNNPAIGNRYFSGDEVILSGQTIPNTEIDFSTFIDEKKAVTNYLSSVLIQPVKTYTFPELNTKSDEKGNFSLSLTSSRSQFFRLFAQTNYLNSSSPESVRLSLQILPFWMIVLFFIKAHILELIILIELTAAAIYFLRRYLSPHVITRKRALAIRKLSPIIELDNR